MNRQRLIAWIHAEIAANGAGSVFLNRGLDPDTGDYEAGEIADEIEQGHFPEVLQVMNAERGEDSMSSYTPGPWYGRKAAGGHQGLIYDESGRAVALTYNPDDADIVAAAPALVEALREMCSAWTNINAMEGEETSADLDRWIRALRYARAALAAAGAEVDA